MDGKLAVARQLDAKHAIELYDPEGAPLGEISLPVIGTISGWSGRPDDGDLYLGLTSFLTPATIYRYDFASATLHTVRAPALPLPVAAFEVRQVFYPSKDEARIPMFLVHGKGLELNGGRAPSISLHAGLLAAAQRAGGGQLPADPAHHC